MVGSTAVAQAVCILNTYAKTNPKTIILGRQLSLELNPFSLLD